ncbi:hypothetical protein Pla123a_28520 [Posidoniimonas polymericola]|uniref:Uncharacterized protein n=1 Tax=Posidoniimonas polymericola TaxID=2528002 RepID=A0A5C5YMI2_9BACT|nr:hypothetical protein [Posidoniimonas polymericola]TWT76065.1 hypothetical protein Pla123a_28520 [Posidoniimonas polymericola]
MNEHSNNDFEARLAAVRPPAVQIDRDRLMYEAGWAAAEAQLARPTIQTTNWWKAASAVSTLAAAALLAVVVQQASPSTSGHTEQAVSPVASAVVEVTEPVEVPPVSTLQKTRPQTSTPPWAAPLRSNPSAPYLVLRQAVVAGQFDEFGIEPDKGVTVVGQPRVLTTSRELMKQMLAEQGLDGSRS